MKFSKGFKILVVLVLLVYAVIFANILAPKQFIDVKKIKNSLTSVFASKKPEPVRYKRIHIPFVQPVDFSSLSKDEILKRRGLAVVNCPVKLDKEYKPNMALYENIDPSKPWFGSSISQNVNLATSLQNPMLLVDFLHPYTFLNRSLEDIGDINPETFVRVDSMLPAIFYTPQTNTIDVYYEVDMYDLKKMNKNIFKYPYRFSLSGVNARDFGYEYVKAKSLDNVKMLGFINPYNSKYKFKDFYGVGGEHFIKSVAYNNQVLPHQSALDFRITSLPAKINLELYKNIFFLFLYNKFILIFSLILF